ncbi:hypothetical protein HB364_21915 [Pseudoflavitalea sp. X16]|uniref:hypothetical protein n=1 Tax=Paraflavitalea devenefica TaxID=2716334 RepID=UPI001422E160|nr:hypothetical protein [Paraflavitalea devenefica]NII27755.1 hypothetical protein [Paraflavitalea devenefica]
MTDNYPTFWQWFANNHERCLGLLTNACPAPTLTKEEFETVFHQYCGQGLYANLEWNQEDNLPRIIISARGDYRHFAGVEALAAAAPLSLPWEVMAFEPPRKPDYCIHERFGHLAFDVDDLLFLPLELYKDIDNGPPVITIYTDIDRPAGKKYQAATEQVIYNVLGEKSTVLDISGIVVERLSRLTEEQQVETAPIDLLSEFIVDLSPPVLGVDEDGKIHYVEQE